MSHLDPEVIETLASGKSTDSSAASHLASCAECRKGVSLARGRQQLLRGLKPYTLSDMAFRRVEARLDEAVREGLPSATPWWRWLGFGAGAVAAAGLAMVLVTHEPATPGTVTLPTPKVELARATFRPLTVIRATKAQARTGENDWRPLAAGDVLQSGEALSADSVTLSDDAVEWAFVASGSMSLGSAAVVTLGAGEVVAKVNSSAAVSVLASSRAFSASAAVFSVNRVGAEVALAVSEGQVDVFDTVSGQRRVVKAPGSLRWSDGSGLSEAREEAAVALAAPVVPAKPWVRFDASTLAAGTVVSLDGAQLGTAPFAELVGAGRRRLMLVRPTGVAIESWADLVGGQAFAPKVELPEKNDGPEPTADALTRVMGELRSQTPKLAACYEKWLKANPTAQGEVTLELTVSAKGKVKRATVGASSISPASAECLVRTAKSLVLSPLGAEATLEVPLVLRSPGR